MKKLLLAGAVASALQCAAVPAWSQSLTGASVKTTCGTASYSAPSYNRPLTQDPNGNLCTGVTFTPSGTQDVNVTKVNGTTALAGAGATGAGSLRVTVAQDSTTVAGGSSLPAGTNVIGHVIADTGSTTAVTQSTASALNATVVGTGTLAVQNTAATPAGTNLIGKTGIDQTTPGTTNNITVSTNVGTLPLIQATASAAVSTASAATLQVVAASGSTVIRVTHWVLVTTLANNVTWESGDTGGSCANPVALTGAMPFAANGGASAGSGLGPVLVLPSGKALCMLTSAATQISGSVAYAQF